MSVLTIRQVQSESDRRTFVKFPFQLYRNNPFWVPPLIADEIRTLQKEHNPAFEFCDAAFWLAMRDGQCVGRLGALIHHLHNEKTGEDAGRFTRAEFIDDREVTDLLFHTAEKWLKDKGMNKVYGPLGFTNLDMQGMLVEGFDHLPSVASVYHLPYYQEHLERLGYRKHIDWVEFRLRVVETPEKARRLAEVIKTRQNLTVQSLRSKKDMLRAGLQIFDVLNVAFAELFSVVPLNDKMKRYYINKYLNVLNPRFIKIILDKDKNMLGFIISVPSLSEAMQKANGKLFPFGFLHLRKAFKNPEVADLFLTAIDPKYQKMGLSALLINELQAILLENGVKYAETTGILETNHDAIQHWKNYDHIQHKRKRCYIKPL
ncbi:MAG TPA: GNAT family N-acetyltransferase [Bacteroidales bacterium]|nr:GNAT family N-acetyltransferase [Bacteroidales bacterium]HNS47091.1 GNAT family N-acetyltransferase [Bacteroidales bacterium]